MGLALPFAAAPAASFYLYGAKGGISPLPARAWEKTGREAGGVSIAVPPGGPDPLRSPQDLDAMRPPPWGVALAVAGSWAGVGPAAVGRAHRSRAAEDPVPGGATASGSLST